MKKFIFTNKSLINVTYCIIALNRKKKADHLARKHAFKGKKREITVSYCNFQFFRHANSNA